LGAEGSSIIRESDCVGISYPDFFKALERAAER
jgi:5-enolpyruvylshikimate-3-phosphate synthase